jgi:hypothetical protein
MGAELAGTAPLEGGGLGHRRGGVHAGAPAEGRSWQNGIRWKA